MDYRAASFWFEVLRWGITIAAALYVWAIGKHKAAKDVADAHERRLIRLEERAEMMPDHDDLSRLYDRVNTLAQGVDNLKGELRQMNYQLRLINSYLLNTKGKPE